MEVIRQLVKCRRLVGHPASQAALLAAHHAVEPASANRRSQAATQTELLAQLPQQLLGAAAHLRRPAEITAGRPHRSRILDGQPARLATEAGADARVGVVAVAKPSLHGRARHAQDARPVGLEIAAERLQQPVCLGPRRQMRVPVGKTQLAVHVGAVLPLRIQQRPLLLVLLEQRRAGHRRVEHELMELRVVADRVLDRFGHVVRSVLLQTDDGGTEDADTVRLQPAHHFPRIRPVQLLVLALLALQPHPHPRNTEPDQLLDSVGLEHVGRAEHVERPALVVFFHQLEQAQRPLAVKQKVLVHHEKRLHPHVALEPDHLAEQLVAGLVKIGELPLAAEHRRSGAKIAPHRATDRGNQRRRRVAGFVRQPDPHGAGADARKDARMADRGLLVLTQKAAEPADALAADNMVRPETLLDARQARNVPPHHNLGMGLKLADKFAHLFSLEVVRRDGADRHHIVALLAQFLGEAIQGRKIQKRVGCRNVVANHHQPPRTVKHPQRKRPLTPRDLVVVKLHRVDGAAAIFVILGIRPEDAGEQNSGPGNFGPGCVGTAVSRQLINHEQHTLTESRHKASHRHQKHGPT